MDGNFAQPRSDATTAELRMAVCLYLIAECREGATIGELARLQLDGNPVTHEVDRVSEAVSQLVDEGEVIIEEERVRTLTDYLIGCRR